jgi:tRNA threonylcarbamoyladenosine biosynthesis protein TsaE
MLTLTTHTPAQTAQYGVLLGRLLLPGDVICLSGNLGAGKTALAGGIGRGWGAHEPVNSPTFVFSHEHHRTRDSQRLYHVDCYRLANADEAESIGLSDMLSGEHIVILEWAERILTLLPDSRLVIRLDLPDDPDSAETTRTLTFEPHGTRPTDLLTQLIAAIRDVTSN